MKGFDCIKKSLLLLTLVLACGTQAFAAQQIPLHLPLIFEPNHGQAPADVDYLLRGGGLVGEFRSGGVSLILPGSRNTSSQVCMCLLNARKNAAISGVGALTGHTNYLFGSDPARWLRGLPNYSQVRYRNVYADTDLLFYGNGRMLEHDFEVRPGGDPSSIAFRLDGAQDVKLTRNGDLQIQLASGAITFERPIAYQTEDGKRHHVDAAFVVGGDGIVHFRLGHYNTSQILVIDPVLSYATYLDNLSDVVAGVATDTAGNTYIAGLTFNTTYPVTSGGFQQQCTSCQNHAPSVFVTKLNATGTAQVYSTFLGGSQYSQPFGLAVDSNGNAVVTGYTQSTDFPVKNPVSTVAAGTGANFAFISSLSPDGSSLNYSSLLGGQATNSNAVAVDARGNAYITGITDSPSYPVTTGALDNVSPQFPDSAVFVSKFSLAGALDYSAIVGESASSGFGSAAIAVDTEGSAYITGTGGTPWPTTTGAYATQLQNASNPAVFVTKLSPDGSKLSYSTFVGAGTGRAIALDSSQNAYVAGQYDSSSSFPVTSGAYMSTSSACCAFFSKVSADGSQLLYSTLFGSSNGNGTTTIYSLSLDATGDIWLAGDTPDYEFPLVNPIQATMPNSLSGSGPTSFLSEFDPTGTHLKFSTYLGDLSGSGLYIALDSNGKVHAAGTTGTSIYTTPGVFLGTIPASSQGESFTYPYAALIDPTVAGATLCLKNVTGQGLAFGNLMPKTTLTDNVQVSNCGNATLTFTSISSSNPGFSIPTGNNGCIGSIAAGSSCTFSVEFAPTAVQAYTGQLTFTSNASVAVTSIPLSGAGADPVASFSSGGGSPDIVFQPMLVGQTSPATFAYLFNNGLVPLTIDQIKVTGDFALATGGNCAAPLPQQSSCLIFMTFTPTAAGTRTGTLSVSSNDPVNPVITTSLTGTGYASYPIPTITGLLNPSYPINSGTTPIGITVSGTNFFPTSVVYVAGVRQPTTYQSNASLAFRLDPTLLNAVGEFPVTVVNSTPGGGTSASYPLIGYLSIPLTASSLVADPVGGMLYAAIPASATQNPNTIIPINPATGAMMTPIPVSTDPQRLAVSADGSELYVATSAGVLQRLNLKTLAIEKTFNLPVDSEWGQTYVQEMHVMPGSPQSIVVELFANVDPFEDGAALYNNSGLVNWLPGEVPTKTPLKLDSFTFTSPSAIYGLPMNSTFFPQVQVSPSGISFSGGGGGETSQVNGSIVRSDGTLLYTNSGQVWNPSTQKLLGTYLEPGGSQLFYADSVVPDTAKGKTYFLDPNAPYGQEQGLGIDVYDQTSYALLGTVPLLSIYSPDAIDLARWGTNGFAFRSTDISGSQPSANQIVVVTSNLIASSSGAPSPILSAVSPASVNANGPAYTMQLTGSGFTHASTVLINGNSRSTTYVSTTSLTAQVLASDIASVGQFDVQVSTPAPGGGASDYVVVSVTAPAKTAPTLKVTPSPTSITNAQPLAVTVAVIGGTEKPVPTGTVILAGGGYTSAGASLSSGSATINIPAGSLSAGTDTLTVAYTPDSASASIYTTATQSATVKVASPLGTTAATISVTPSATSITNLQTDGVTVALAGASGQATPTGTVILSSGAYSASQPIVSGTASFTIPGGTLSSGANTLTATYSGDAIYAGASGTTTVTISQLVVTAPAPSPVSPGASATTSVVFMAGSSYSGTMNLACTLSTSPAGAQSLPTCSLNPTSVAITAGGSGTTTLTVNTTATSTTARMRRFQQHMFGFGGSGATLAVVLLFGIPFRRRRWAASAILLCVISTAAVLGCGASGGSGTPPVTTGVPATSAGAYTFTVTGTDSVNSKIMVSSVVTITVQ